MSQHKGTNKATENVTEFKYLGIMNRTTMKLNCEITLGE